MSRFIVVENFNETPVTDQTFATYDEAFAFAEELCIEEDSEDPACVEKDYAIVEVF